jgi:hypothetical protein
MRDREKMTAHEQMRSLAAGKYRVDRDAEGFPLAGPEPERLWNKRSRVGSIGLAAGGQLKTKQRLPHHARYRSA